MDTTDVAGRYFDAWNGHDEEAVAAAFVPGGEYRDPGVPDGLDPAATGAYAAGLWEAFPDLAFGVDDLVADGDRVWARWTMTGTNDGPYRGLPPSGRPITLPGADLLRVEPGGVRSVQGFFDGGTLVRQLGLQVIVQPERVGPFRFGNSVWASRGSAEPGAVSLTVLEALSDEVQEEVRERTRVVVSALMEQPGFISVLAASVGRRMYTVAAWERPEDVERLRESPHADAVRWFFGSGVALGAQTGVWAPHRLNGMWVRCDDCGEMVQSGNGRCAAGHELREAPAYW
ncbi:MAG TPA: ester cyclase [Miltoncostaea sp.]|nr:ester cyclase [Miltoncostaea sp.]